MKKVSLLILFCLFFPLVQKAQNVNGISFQQARDWKAVLAKAMAENKNVFVDVYTTWCGPCKMMDLNVYSDQGVSEVINKDFISIKVQMDSTANDDDYIKSWYKEADMLKKNANIVAYPSFLFYSPKGEILYKSFGYKDAEQFITLAKFASDSKRTNFRNQLSDYQNGIKDYSLMPDLAKTTREMLGDYKLALTIAKDYKQNYLDKLNNDDFMRPQNIRFIEDNGNVALISINDLFFYNCYHFPKDVDSILGKGRARVYVSNVLKTNVINLCYLRVIKP